MRLMTNPAVGGFFMAKMTRRGAIKFAAIATGLVFSRESAIAGVCTSCRGSGTGPFRCFFCKGSGKNGRLRCNFCMGRGFQNCSSCNGRGMTPNPTICTSCKGSGTGPLQCFFCEGTGMNGRFKCNFCMGRRFQNCSSCNGRGQR